ncbi:hypothetical protein EBU95_20865, partial [bacterium]|nr:hypothetical protein [bacterium]
MAFQISPGVNVSEIDLTTVVPSVQSTAGAFAGTFQWGPANKLKLIDSEITLTKTFGEPDSNSAVSFFTSANFLAYGNNIQIVRAVGANSFNADANTSATNVQITNEDVFEASYLNVSQNNLYGAFISRYPGVLGNSIDVAVCANNSTFSTWTYKSYFTSAPGTSDYVSAANGSNDEMHIVIVDRGGLFTGTANTVLETYAFVSAASDASLNGSTNYYKQVIFNNSKYVYAVDPVSYSITSSTWGQPAANTTFARLTSNELVSLAGGTDEVPSDANLQNAYSNFANKESVDISLLMTGNASVTIQQYVIDNIATTRMDCVAFISPPYSSVVNQA